MSQVLRSSLFTLYNVTIDDIYMVTACGGKHYRIYPKYSDTSTPYHTCSLVSGERMCTILVNRLED